MKIAANLKWLFTELPELDRPAAARAAGFDGVEIISPYEQSPDVWRQVLGNLPVCLINSPSHGPALGCAAVPGAEGKFHDDFARAVAYAQVFRSERIHILAGREAGRQAGLTFRRNLEWAAGVADVPHLTIEPLNPKDMPGYFLNDFDQAEQVIRDVASPKLGLQFDIWHAHRMHGDVAAVWGRLAHHVTHVQIAGLESRAEPCEATLGFVRHIARQGYSGWIAGEYAPAAPNQFGWLGALDDYRT